MPVVEVAPELNRETILPFLQEVMARRGSEDYGGEGVTQVEHGLQAAMLAQQAGCDDEVIVAALLHDMGHFCHEFGLNPEERGIDDLHEEAGAAVLEPFFSKRLVDIVRLHVPAKRYLCAVDPSYFDGLSPASVRSLALQGGPMNADETAAFEAEPFHADAVQVRRFDDLAKIPGMVTLEFEAYLPKIEAALV